VASGPDSWWLDELRHAGRENEPMIERAGFEITTAEHDGSGMFARYLCTRR
jgi:hypothetical protein